MKSQGLLLFICLFFSSMRAQDTTELVKHKDGSLAFKLITKKDTALICTYPNRKWESYRPVKNNMVNGSYLRWYENGNPMWKKEMKNNVQEGKAAYYDRTGRRVAELFYKNGKIKETFFILENTHLVLGKISFTSKVYGGMEREDGSSNISEHSGPYQNCAMYAVILDPLKKPKFICFFKSDAFGDFIIVAPEGKIGFYPKEIKLSSLPVGYSEIPDVITGSGHSGWSIKEPLIVGEEDTLLFVELKHFSEGYAP